MVLLRQACASVKISAADAVSIWPTEGDETSMCLETFWRNAPMEPTLPHVGDFEPVKN